MKNHIKPLLPLFLLISINAFADDFGNIPVKCEVGDILYFNDLTTYDLSKDKTGHTAIYAGQEFVNGEWVDFIYDIYPWGQTGYVTKRPLKYKNLVGYPMGYEDTNLMCSGIFTHSSLFNNTYSTGNKQKRDSIIQKAENIPGTSADFTSETADREYSEPGYSGNRMTLIGK
ncbi:MAG: hypothetical protein JW774_10755 [Candidatus Aureabacteria bacterium]|nr:hypothetical protein [Candidatus Auribacterota bacterium]